MSEKTEQYRFKNREEYENFLDTAPVENHIQKRSLGGGKVHSFLPLFIQDAQADFVFKEWNVIKETPMALQGGVASTVTILALPSYPEAQHITFTGSAAVMFKDTKNAVEFDLPASRSRAIGNALMTLGNVFGRSLNRTYKHNERKVGVSPDFSLRRKKEPKKDV